MAEKKKMSVAEILAAARKADSKGESDAPAQSAPAEETPQAAEAAVAAEPVAQAAEEPAAESAPKPAPAKGARPSVAEMLALARAEKAKAAGGEAKPAPKPAAAPAAKAPAKPAEKPAVKAAPKPAKETVAAGPKPIRDTASILAAARAGAKAGPMSKAEAATKAKPVKPAVKAKAVTAKPARPKMPVKPAAFTARPRAELTPPEEDRRGFLGMLVGAGLGFTAMSVTFGLWALGTARFMFPNVLTEPPSRFKVGPPANFPPGQVETKFVALFGVWVVNGEYQGQREIYALRTVCTHLGCTPNWLEGEQKFKCPCHGSGFYKDGINFEGPAPRPLERYSIGLADDGQLQIDKSKTFQEELGQWLNPESFVPV